MQEFGYHTNFQSKDPSEEWRDCVAAVDVAALDREARPTRLKEASS
jgi:hypothetical protein